MLAATSPPVSPNPNDLIPVFAASVTTGGGSGPIDPNVVLTNLIFTFLFVFLFGVTSEVFNSTIDENREEIEAWVARFGRGPRGILAPIHRIDAFIDGLSEQGRAGTAAHAGLVLLVTGLVYGFLSPDFGLNEPSAILFVSLVVGLGIVTYTTEGGAALLAVRRYRAQSTVRLYGTAVLVAVLCVIASRLINFEPGVVYGFIASTVVVAPVVLSRRNEAQLVLVPALVLLVVSLLARAALVPIAQAAESGNGWLIALVDTVLSTIFVAGIEGLFFSLLPLKFMDGHVIMRWSRVVWALMFGSVTFFWWQFLLNGDSQYVDALKQANVQLALVILVVFVTVTGGTWLFFRLRHHEGQEESTEALAEMESRE